MMLDFRCNMLDERGHTLFSADIAAENLEAAIEHAADILHTSNQSTSSRRVYSFEVWSGTTRLFPTPLNTQSVVTGSSRHLPQRRDVGHIDTEDAAD
jgi:hypothetical protein